MGRSEEKEAALLRATESKDQQMQCTMSYQQSIWRLCGNALVLSLTMESIIINHPQRRILCMYKNDSKPKLTPPSPLYIQGLFSAYSCYILGGGALKSK